MTEEQNLTKKQRRELKKQEKLDKQESESRQRKLRSLMIWVVVLIVLGGIVWLVVRAGSGNNSGEGTVTNTDILTTVNEGANIKGNPDASVKVVEYSDFQCPACGFYKPIVDKLIEDLGDKITFEYRHFPLRSNHPNALRAAQASEAADLQGKFWEMYDKLFDNQKDWSNLSNSEVKKRFIEYAGEIGLDQTKFESDLNSDIVKNTVEQDEQEARQLNLTGTPSFFVNGIKIKNTNSYDEFRKIIESEVNWNS